MCLRVSLLVLHSTSSFTLNRHMLNVFLFFSFFINLKLEFHLAKKDDIIAIKDKRISMLEAEVSIIKSSKGAFYDEVTGKTSWCCYTDSDEYDHNLDQDREQTHMQSGVPKLAHSFTVANGRANVTQSPNHVSDDSCLESEKSFRQDTESISQVNLANEDSLIACDGRWNIPFDDFSEDLVAKSPPNCGTTDEYALEEIRFIPIKDHCEHFSRVKEKYGRAVVTPVRPFAKRGAYSFSQPDVSPITQAVRLGLLEESVMDKENIDPVLMTVVKTYLSEGLMSPCR